MVEGERALREYSDKWFLSLYLKYGSVEEAVGSYPGSLPISVANFHRLVKKYGLIKSAGRHVSFPETLHFFREKAFEPGAPLERIYKNMPPTFRTSLSTLHRIYQYMERTLVRRYATALVIARDGARGSILVGRELSGNSRYGKKVGDISLPMSFSKRDEPHHDSALRVLQQEVFSSLAMEGKLKRNSEFVRSMLPEKIEPLFYFDIVDVRVGVFELTLGNIDYDFSSYKLTGHSFENLNNIDSEHARAGVVEILNIYEGYLHNPYTVKFPTYHISAINLAMLPDKVSK